MKKNILFAAALTVLGTSVWAQETPAPVEPAIAPVQVTEPAVPADAAAAQPAAPQQLAVRTLGTFGSWIVTCTEAEGACLARQEIPLSKDEKGPVLAVFLEKASADAPLVLTAGTPVGVAIQPGVSLILNQDDKARVWYAPFESCLQTMCIASAPVNESVLSGAMNPAIAFSLANYELVGVKFSTEGMEEAVKTLVDNAPAPATKGSAPPAASEPEAPVAPTE